MIAIINYGLGNLGSIKNMLKMIGEKSIITDDPQIIKDSDKIILPGVGSFDEGMSQLDKRNLIAVLQEEASNGKPILGICLGMQLLGIDSEEGVKKGLNLIPFHNIKFNFQDISINKSQLKIPHMGWNEVELNKYTKITSDIGEKQRYYFVHTYHAVCENPNDILLTCNYGYDFTAAVQKDNIIGVQFHPEKSHDFGMKILKNFAGIK
jgi:imidazole glycerol-phosphate synthase subunit HisH